MPDFLDRLGDVLDARRGELVRHLRAEPTEQEARLQRLVATHWSPLPPTPGDAAEHGAYAVDGSLREIGLDHGGRLIVVQALALGQGGYEAADVDLRALPASTPGSTAARVADLLQQRLELRVACRVVDQAGPDSTLYLDGALYGRLPQLYPLPLDELPALLRLPEEVLELHLQLLATARERRVRLLAVSKTSHQATHAKLWLEGDEPAQLELPEELSDSALIQRMTDGRAGVSTPVVLGGWGFTGGSREILERDEVAASPAIVSFFVRLADFDDALRVDLPAHQCGADVRLADLEGQVLAAGAPAVADAVALLAGDYGGLEVYNALLYGVDREVRLRREVVREVYVPMIEGALGVNVRANRSERRFG